MTLVALYARYSSHNQYAASIPPRGTNCGFAACMRRSRAGRSRTATMTAPSSVRL